MNYRTGNQSLGGSKRILGLDFGKYLLSSDKRLKMESDNTTGTESDISDWEVTGRRGVMSENSEDSDDYGIYYGQGQSRLPQMFDTAIDSGDTHSLGSQGHYKGQDDFSRREYGGEGQNSQQMRQIISQLNTSQVDSAYSGSGSLYPIHETSSLATESSGSNDENSEGTVSNSGSPIHNPVYGRYQKINQNVDSDQLNQVSNNSDEVLDILMLHRLPGENLGMILGIEGGKGGSDKVSSVAVKSVTLGGAGYRATGSSKGVCVGDEILQVNSTDLRTLTHDECISVFKDMPLRVMLGIKRGQKDSPAVAISPSSVVQLQTQKNGGKDNNKQSARVKGVATQQPVKITRRKDLSDSEDDNFGGFARYHVTVEKHPEENLGLSIVPSYGSTKEYYQIKRILPSGTSAQSGQLHVGDRLISCNRTSLRALTQNHCLNILKSASSRGDVNFEVIRPIYDGHSMEISVTVNNTNTQIPTFDPQQYSVKSQSYDRHKVDVVVTSESEDYLTVSEDEYSRTGRLADIPEVEANEVFASNKVKLAFQKPFSSIEEESTETETDTEVNHIHPSVSNEDNVDIVDLNKVDTSPYHIPHKAGIQSKDFSSYAINKPQGKETVNPISSVPVPHDIPKADIANISLNSSISSNRHQAPITDIDAVSLSSISPRSTIPNTNLDTISVSSANRVSPVPNTDLDTVSIASSSYSKRQQVPTDNSRNISPPYNYPSDNVHQNIPVSDIDSVRHNPLYKDNDTSDYTDTESAPDIYIASPYNSPRNQIVTSTDLDILSIGSNQELEQINETVHSDLNALEEALPPPLEFSDIDAISLPVTNIDDLESESSPSVEVSPSHHHIEIVKTDPTYTQHSRHFAQESSFRELERASSDKPGSLSIEESDSDLELAFNAELTAPFDSVLQEQGYCVQDSFNVPVEFADSDNQEVLQIVQNNEDGTIVISQFEPEVTRESSDSPTYIVNYSTIPDSTMDLNSETMLKDALDMEYENLPESSKYESRISLGDKVQSQEHDMDDPNFVNQNIPAEGIAKEIIQNEGSAFGYYMESDDEPDHMPDQDAPEDLPDLPDQPPPMLMNFTNGYGNASNNIEDFDSKPIEIVTSTSGLDVKLVPTNDIKTESAVPVDETVDSERVVRDTNWSFKTKTFENDKDNEEEIVPIKNQRKVDIPITYMEEKSSAMGHNESDIVVPVKVERKIELPASFNSNANSQISVSQADILEEAEKPSITVTTKRNKPAIAPKPAKKPKITTVTVGNELESEPVVEETFTATEHKKDNAMSINKTPEPVIEEVFTATEHKKDHTKNIVNVISVVNALKAGAKDKDPDIVDQIVKEEKTNKLNKSVSAMIKLTKDNNDEGNQQIEISPPKKEVIVTEKEKISVKKEKAIEISPPKQDVIVTQKDSIKKPVVRNIEPSMLETNNNKIVNKTTIEIAKPNIPSKVTVDLTSKPADVASQQPSNETNVHSMSPVVKSDPTANVPIMKTSIKVESPRNITNSNPDQKQYEKSVPQLDLNPISVGNNNSESTKTDISMKKLPSPSAVSPTSPSTYKTTIGVTNKPETKPDKPSLAPTPAFKPLSQIKPLSFNPKSLSSSTRPVQYKTTVSSLSSSLRSSLSTSQKADYPIKRMETMPFEVSILKGILGIGIKTTMTPDGLVQVSEILPSGPVGREGNIKVGDYILSINNTSLSGLPDSKVQQILRLLPRGLSKIVASAITPEKDAEKTVPPVEKQKLSPRQSAPLPSSRQPTITTTPNSVVISSPGQRVAPITMTTGKTPSPNLSPRSPDVSPRQPTVSPRQQDNTVISPRNPPNVAPKPAKRSLPNVSSQEPQIIESVPEQKPLDTNKTEDPNQPIEAELFVSINGPKSEHVPTSSTGPNILPGSVNYDSVKNNVQSENKSKWTPGVVSSADISVQNTTNSLGKLDVVQDTNSPNTESNTNTDHSVNMNVVVKPEVDSNEKVENLELNKTAERNEEAFKSLDESLSESQTEGSLLLNRSRTFSTSSETSSYTDFTECNVEDDLIPEQIVEEDETFPVKEFETIKEHDEKYESDFEEIDDIVEAEAVTKVNAEPDSKSIDSGVNMDVLQNLAENIVSEVLSTVKQMDINYASQTEEDETPALPTEGPPLPDESQPTIAEVPPLPTEAPPLPDQAPPLPEAELPLDEQAEYEAPHLPSMSAPVVDLTLYPDETETSEDAVETVNTETKPVVDIIDMVHTDTLHAEAPVINVVKAPTDDFNDHSNSSSQQVTEDSNIQQEDKHQVNGLDNGLDDKNGDQSINAVISMYSDIEKASGNENDTVTIVVPGENNDRNDNMSLESLSMATDVNENKIDDLKEINVEMVIDETESVETKSLTSSEDVLSDVDASESRTEVEVNNIIGQTGTSEKVIDEIDVTQNNFEDSTKRLNGHANDHSQSKVETKTKPATLDLKVGENNEDIDSPRSLSAYSPRSLETIMAEEEASRGKYSPEANRMIKMLSVDDAPHKEGEGQIMVMTMEKGVTGLGFIIQGGMMSPKGDLPLTIKKIFKGGPADGLLQIGDELCEVDGEDMSVMRHSEARNHIKFLPSGHFSIKIRRFKMVENDEE